MLEFSITNPLMSSDSVHVMLQVEFVETCRYSISLKTMNIYVLSAGKCLQPIRHDCQL